MKLYYFNPNDYGQEYITMANTEKEACINVYDYLTKQAKATKYNPKIYLDNRDSMFNSKKELLPAKEYSSKNGRKRYEGYTIEVYEAGEVIETELS